MWLEGYTPDIVLLHIGTNDVFASQTTASTAGEIKQILEALRSDNPKVQVLLAKLISTENPDSNQRINELNREIEGIAASTSTIESRVVVVDQNLGFDVSEDTYDGIHPNLTGEVKMAEKWSEAIVEAVAILS
jgi:lysophospholipase L1-like esterase